MTAADLPARITIGAGVDLDHPHTRALIGYCLHDPDERDWFVGSCAPAERKPWWRRGSSPGTGRSGLR